MTITLLAPDGVPVTAMQERQAKAALYGGGSGRALGGRSGFRVGTDITTLVATATQWTLKPCAAQLDPGASTHQGMYGWSSDADVTGPVTAADSTYTRKDIVYIRVDDSSAGDGSGATQAPVVYLAGTPAASPVAPTLPARSFLIGFSFDACDAPQRSGSALPPRVQSSNDHCDVVYVGIAARNGINAGREFPRIGFDPTGSTGSRQAALRRRKRIDDTRKNSPPINA